MSCDTGTSGDEQLSLLTASQVAKVLRRHHGEQRLRLNPQEMAAALNAALGIELSPRQLKAVFVAMGSADATGSVSVLELAKFVKAHDDPLQISPTAALSKKAAAAESRAAYDDFDVIFV